MNLNQRDSYPLHFESQVQLPADAEQVFSYLDDPKNLSLHMSQSSWMMAGSKMNIKLDSNSGHGVGAEIILEGKMLGIVLSIKEYVVESRKPFRKVWETNGPQRMMILDQYRMGFELTPFSRGVTLKVFIDYALPPRGLGNLLGQMFGNLYARWCTDQTILGALQYFSEQ